MFFIELFLVLAGVYYVTVVLNFIGVPIFSAEIKLENALKPFYYWRYGWEEPEVIVRAKKGPGDEIVDNPKIEKKENLK